LKVWDPTLYTLWSMREK